MFYELWERIWARATYITFDCSRAVTFIFKRIEEFAPEGIKGSVLGHFKSSQSLVKWVFASLFFALWYYFGTKVSCVGIVSFTPEAMLFSTQNIHLVKSLNYLISFSFHTIPKVNHLPIHIQKLMRQVSLHFHNRLHCKLVWRSRKVLQVSLWRESKWGQWNSLRAAWWYWS